MEETQRSRLSRKLDAEVMEAWNRSPLSPNGGRETYVGFMMDYLRKRLIECRGRLEDLTQEEDSE